LQYRVVATLSHTELEAELEGDTDEYRMELQINQVRPRYAVPSAAFVPVRAGREADVEAAQIVDEPDLAAYRDALTDP
jgi:hypothetical protein